MSASKFSACYAVGIVLLVLAASAVRPVRGNSFDMPVHTGEPKPSTGAGTKVGAATAGVAGVLVLSGGLVAWRSKLNNDNITKQTSSVLRDDDSMIESFDGFSAPSPEVVDVEYTPPAQAKKSRRWFSSSRSFNLDNFLENVTPSSSRSSSKKTGSQIMIPPGYFGELDDEQV